MSVFSKLEGESVVLVTNGVYRQAGVFTYKGRLFASYGSGFLLLHKEDCGHCATSNPRISWESLSVAGYFTVQGKTPLFFQGE